MVCVNTYTREYINQCRERMEAQLAARRELVASGRDQRSAQPAFDAALGAFDPVFFNTLLLALDYSFVERSRTVELSDGNPLNEVRILCHSILRNRGVLASDPAIEYSAARSVLGIEVGQAIRLREPEFVRLLNAFIAELESKFAAA